MRSRLEVLYAPVLLKSIVFMSEEMLSFDNCVSDLRRERVESDATQNLAGGNQQKVLGVNQLSLSRLVLGRNRRNRAWQLKQWKSSEIELEMGGLADHPSFIAQNTNPTESGR